jgi:hypothetical protein
MTDDGHDRQEGDRQHGAPARSRARRRRIWLALAVLILLIAAVIFVPGFFSLNKYKGRIAGLIGASLGRPVRLSNVEPRLFPRPGFVITDLSVAEDPAYGAEPVLHADTVTASIRLLSLLGGRLAIDRISMDDASLNLVRMGPGKWNLAQLFRTAAKVGGGEARRAVQLPTLEATASRINIKDGVEKLPFSLVNTDFEFWEAEPGEWRIRLRGQPARTDLSLNLEDTGEVRLEASLRRAPELTAMPVNLDLEWREAQLGQLARLVTGSDPGWRGDLTGELHLEGTADAAQIRTQLRATNVHRAEFAPVDALDFDANCSLLYHYSQRALENGVCDSPLGGGRVHLTGDLPAGAAAPKFTVELDRVPVEAGLGALRTVRNGVAADLEAGGTVSGKIAYEAQAPASAAPKPAAKGKRRGRQAAEAVPGPLTGSLTVDGLQLSGAGLSQPVRAARVVLEPAPDSDAANAPVALAGTMTIPAGGAAPLALGVRLGAAGYQLTVHGQASVARARELAVAAGLGSPAGPGSPAGLDGLSGPSCAGSDRGRSVAACGADSGRGGERADGRGRPERYSDDAECGVERGFSGRARADCTGDAALERRPDALGPGGVQLRVIEGNGDAAAAGAVRSRGDVRAAVSGAVWRPECGDCADGDPGGGEAGGDAAFEPHRPAASLVYAALAEAGGDGEGQLTGAGAGDAARCLGDGGD